MKINDAKASIKGLLQKDHCPCLIGPSGIGKTQLINQIAQEIDYDLVDMRLIYRDPVDLRGLPIIDAQRGMTRWLPPEEFVANGRKKLIFLDEINNALAAVQAGSYQLIEERRIGTIDLPPGTLFCAAMNRQSDKGVWNATPMPLRRRWFEIDVETHIDDWAEWATTHDVPPVGIGFLRTRPDLLYQDSTKEGTLGCDPRGWVKLFSVLEVIPRNNLLEISKGKVGPAASEFCAHVDLVDKLPDPQTIIRDPKKAPVPKSSEAAKLYAIAAALAYHATAQNLGQILIYLDRMPPEYSTLTMKDACRRDEKLSQKSPAFKEWVIKNRDILNV